MRTLNELFAMLARCEDGEDGAWWTEDEAVEFIMGTRGCSREEAEKVFDRWLKENRLDPRQVRPIQ